MAAKNATYVVDARAVTELEPLKALLGRGDVTKLVHNASFERSVLGRYGIEVAAIIDTLEVSRERHGRAAVGGHSLSAVCVRELGRALDKSEQVSDWTRRPLTGDQLTYAALDAEVLLELAPRLGLNPALTSRSCVRITT